MKALIWTLTPPYVRTLSGPAKLGVASAGKSMKCAKGYRVGCDLPACGLFPVTEIRAIPDALRGRPPLHDSLPFLLVMIAILANRAYSLKQINEYKSNQHGKAIAKKSTCQLFLHAQKVTFGHKHCDEWLSPTPWLPEDGDAALDRMPRLCQVRRSRARLTGFQFSLDRTSPHRPERPAEKQARAHSSATDRGLRG